MGMENTRFCPLHGDYPIADQGTACPECRADPEQSTLSLQRVRVLDTGAISTLATGDSQLTPIENEVPCPVCATEVPLADFRYEAMGEVWTREAAEWAEEGVCPSCYRDILPPYIREWSDGEWLSHHYEGWRNTVDAVAEIFKYQDSAHESWLPPEQRHRLLDVEATLSSRREHLSLCQSAMEDLLNRYPSSITPPPFDQLLSNARERSLSSMALDELKDMHRKDLEDENARRELSVRHDTRQEESRPGGVELGPVSDAPISSELAEEPGGMANEAIERDTRRWPAVVAGVLVLAVLIWLLSRV